MIGQTDECDGITSQCGLLRLECLRKQLRRTSTPDSNRMVLEFLGSQTLLEVHEAIVELTDDELWRYNVMNDQGTASTDSDTGNNTDVTDNENKSYDHNTQQQLLEDHTSISSSGYFFIENTFYITGTVDYTTPIMKWLQSGTAREQKRRMEHLGIGPNLPNILSMADVRLYDLPTRLGVRYVHVHHGDVECAIFATDRRLMSQRRVDQLQFPIIHDIWTPSYSIPECEICQNRVAVIATSTTCAVTNGHRALCEACCRQLRLQITSRDKIERYTVWRSQPDLSAGASNDTAW
jgi:snRNA-activating protein complex (SNAPc), subunit 3